ncbi:hypothetical protein JYK14_24585 [Siccirubricoccus sp. KC 17139]|uniref:XRE family transcriptional regulator n=1 Tax=Siccirubricoccus soli TaxID=2899147 RepID=A0ABT1DBK5_9PROT|nr:hypothetical protein [Siccirubricoccus soli]MCO6419313.1 hypothetical protein [Siccirubricoccus soli]MCP2685448.1 hypothetical protein [Siccirubricoccus soli]
MGVDISLLQRWVSGDRPMPGWLDAALVEAVRAERRRHLEQAARLEALEAELG